MIVALSEYLNGHISMSGTLYIILLASEFFLPPELQAETGNNKIN